MIQKSTSYAKITVFRLRNMLGIDDTVIVNDGKVGFMDRAFVRQIFSLPHTDELYYQAEKKTGVFVYSAIIAVFICVFNIPAVSRVTGITLDETLLLTAIYYVCNIIPYFAIEKFHKLKFYGISELLLLTVLSSMIYIFSNNFHPVWMFYLLYAGAAGNAFALNFYAALILASGPLASALINTMQGSSAESLREWITLSIMSLMGVLFYWYAGSMTTRYMKITQRTAELEKYVAMEKEKARLSRDIHDSIGAEFTVILSQAELAKIGLKEGRNMSELFEMLDKMEDSSRRGIQDLRNVVWALDPESISSDYLIAYIKEYTYKLLNAGGIMLKVQKEIDNGTSIASGTVLALFRIIQEACNNALKHSEADNLFISFKNSGPNLLATIKDNGRGFVMDEVQKGKGLMNMQKRADNAGGKLEYSTSPGKGTQIQVSLPFK